jgi:hypothetical protein
MANLRLKLLSSLDFCFFLVLDFLPIGFLAPWIGRSV